MLLTRVVFLSVLAATLSLFLPTAKAAEQSSAGFIDAPGKELLQSKCFQCHSEGMWKDLKQDKRKWEGVLYRMIGRGALWTEQEINAMADYLAVAFGPQGEKSVNK